MAIVKVKKEEKLHSEHDSGFLAFEFFGGMNLPEMTNDQMEIALVSLFSAPEIVETNDNPPPDEIREEFASKIRKLKDQVAAKFESDDELMDWLHNP